MKQLLSVGLVASVPGLLIAVVLLAFTTTSISIATRLQVVTMLGVSSALGGLVVYGLGTQQEDY